MNVIKEVGQLKQDMEVVMKAIINTDRKIEMVGDDEVARVRKKAAKRYVRTTRKIAVAGLVVQTVCLALIIVLYVTR